VPRDGWHAYNGVYRPQVVVRSYRDAFLPHRGTTPDPIPPPTPIPEVIPDIRTLSETKIANAALVCLGERRINDLFEDTKHASLLSLHFDNVRDALLRSTNWLFATHRAELTASATSPIFGYAYRYEMPRDFVRLLDVDDRWGFGWDIEGNAVVTNLASPLQITYIRRVTDPVQMDPMFRELLGVALAFELAGPITGDAGRVESIAIKFYNMLNDAREANGDGDIVRYTDLTDWQRLRGEK